MAKAKSLLLALPSDVLQRLLAGIPLADHKSTAAACRTFRAVITDPRFIARRLEYGLGPLARYGRQCLAGVSRRGPGRGRLK